MNNNLPYFVLLYSNIRKKCVKINDANKLEREITGEILENFRQLKELSKDPINDFYLEIPTQLELLQNMMEYINKKNALQIIPEEGQNISFESKLRYLKYCLNVLYKLNLDEGILSIVECWMGELREKIDGSLIEGECVECETSICEDKAKNVGKKSRVKSKWTVKKSGAFLNKTVKTPLKFNSFFNEEIVYYKQNTEEGSLSSEQNIELPLPCDTVIRSRKKGYKLINGRINNVAECVFAYFFNECFGVKYAKLRSVVRKIEEEFKSIYG